MTEAATPQQGNSAKKRFHANDPLIVGHSKHGLKKIKREKKTDTSDEKQGNPQKGARIEENQKESPIATVRSYQMTILRKALQENTIVYLETGCGKTLIAILLMKELASSMREKKQKFLTVFMAPTVCLVEQQASVVKINTDLQVDSFYGDKGVDHWSSAMWDEQVRINEVLVMTPQVYLDALRHGFLKMETFHLLIFDECHQAQKQNPYAKIMRDYYHKLTSKRPRVFGMTASPVTRKGVASTEDSAKQMQQLENLLDAKVFTLDDKRELEFYVPSPIQKIKYFPPANHAFEHVMCQLNSIKDKHEGSYNAALAIKDGYKDMEVVATKLWQKVRKLHGSLVYSLEQLGLWCAQQAAICLLKKIKTDGRYEDVDEKIQNTKESFLIEASKVLDAAMQEKGKSFVSVEDGIAVVEEGLLTPKVLQLVDCLMKYENIDSLRCIVFVERVVTAMVLARILAQVGCLSFLACSFLAGTTTSLDVMGQKQQKHTLAEFQSGKINVLIATDVAEEGLDVQRCSSVIRFDMSKTVRSYIQSRGRARMPGSDYIIFIEDGNMKQSEQLSQLMQSEESMRDQALNRTHYPIIVEKTMPEDMEMFRIESTGATVSIDSSISLVTRFCSKLPGDRYYRPQPEFVFEKIEGDDASHVCKLILPPNGPFRELIGPPKRNRVLAKQAVCLEACRQLHAMGQITDHLVPFIDVDNPEEEEVMNMTGKNVAGAGTNKRKELHGTAETQCLRGDWSSRSEAVLLHAYLIWFEFTQKEEDPYADFVLLLEAAIDEDIANTEFKIYLSNGRMAIAKISDAGPYSLSVEQLRDAKDFHQLLFNGMFGRLVKRSKKSELPMKIVLASQTAMKEMWDHPHKYLLLPLLPGKLTEELEEIPIDWEAVREAAFTVNKFSRLFLKSKTTLAEKVGKKSMCNEGTIEMASGSIPASKLRGMAVVTIHTGRIYTVVDVLQDKNADSPIEVQQDSSYSSYAQYFKEKYKKVLEHPQQPLLQVKQSHRIHNLLTVGVATNTKKNKGQTEKVKKPIMVELPPELCLCTGVSSEVIRTLYLFPSVLHRFNALLLAGQLRTRISKDMPQCASINATRMMEALTTLRCLEGYSLEGLELLGDSYLKYAVSRYLYLVYENKHEGQLSARRCRVICNEKLHQLAISKQLPGYIRDEPFQPEYWHAPGMLCSKRVACKCNLENLACLGSSDYDKADPETSRVFRIGKTCSKGHRWLCSKTISDVVEALIGAFVTGSASGSALGFMKWMGFDIDFDMGLYKIARDRCSVHSKVLNGVNIAGIETQLGYVFVNKSLLVEALTHASQQDHFKGCCYQRLEFLGDAVLDFLITRHLFTSYPGLSPGVLSDLRSAAVNNECFARSAVKHNLQRYLRHGSGELLSQITSFVTAVKNDEAGQQDRSFGWEGVRGPKVLGDLVESIAGAILVDSGFDSDMVWSVMERLLSPLVTPSTLPLHPIRELHELCQSKGVLFVWKKAPNNGKLAVASAELKIGDEVITQIGTGPLKKTAKKDAAQQVLATLRSRGIVHPRWQVEAKESSDVAIADRRAMEETRVSEKRVFNGEVGGSEAKRQRLLHGDATLQCESIQLMERFGSGATKEVGLMGESPECATSINLKRSVSAGSKSEDEAASASCEDSSTMPQPLFQSQRNDLIIDIATKSMDVMESSKKSIGLDDIKIMEKGRGRAKLNEFCITNKWSLPVYELVAQEGQAHVEKFTISAQVSGPYGKFTCTSEPMPRKNQAKDDAAAKVLLVLAREGHLRG